jgi:hypothetical protein
VYVDNRNGYFTADELARIQDTINGLDTMLAPFSVTITEVSDPGSANLVLDNGTTSASGGAADGVLGCFNGAAGEITILQGWNWYAGADSTLIGSSQYDFQSVVTHELGHALGLGHSPNTASPMYETLATGQVHRTMTVADLNIPDPPSGADPERAALSFWQQVYFGVEPSLAKGEVENWNNTPASSQQTALKTVLPDLTATADFADRAARMLVDGQNERLLQRVSLPITDDQADFWSSIGGTPGLDNVIGPTGDLAGQ